MIEVLAILLLLGILVYRRLTVFQGFDTTFVGRRPSMKVGARGQKGYVTFHSRDTKKKQKPRKTATRKTATKSELKSPWGW
jgi:hypothetical protein